MNDLLRPYLESTDHNWDIISYNYSGNNSLYCKICHAIIYLNIKNEIRFSPGLYKPFQNQINSCAEIIVKDVLE